MDRHSKAQLAVQRISEALHESELDVDDGVMVLASLLAGALHDHPIAELERLITRFARSARRCHASYQLDGGPHTFPASATRH